ncbi:hypothetical protein BH18THE1_BH18THE1_12160 [soil metagenome]
MKTSAAVSYKSYLNLRNLFKTSSFPLSTLTSIDGLLKTGYPLTMYDDIRSIISDQIKDDYFRLHLEKINKLKNP